MTVNQRGSSRSRYDRRAIRIDEALKSLDPDAARPECHAVTNWTLGFSGRMVLADVNVALKRGSITALIGPTGSGKSTFLRTLNRMNDQVPGFRLGGRRHARRGEHLGPAPTCSPCGAGSACSSSGRTPSRCRSGTTWWPG